jgi:hypothetical protein
MVDSQRVCTVRGTFEEGLFEDVDHVRVEDLSGRDAGFVRLVIKLQQHSGSLLILHNSHHSRDTIRGREDPEHDLLSSMVGLESHVGDRDGFQVIGRNNARRVRRWDLRGSDCVFARLRAI